MKTKTVVMSVFVGALSVLTAQAATYYVDNTLGNNRVWINNKHITLKSTDGAAILVR